MADQKILTTNHAESARVNRQIVLPFAKSVEISLKSIKVRFFRSLITTMSLVLAVSFLSFVRISNDVANGLLATQDRQLRQAVIRAGYDVGPEDTNVGAQTALDYYPIASGLCRGDRKCTAHGRNGAVSRNRYHEMFRCSGPVHPATLYS